MFRAAFLRKVPLFIRNFTENVVLCLLAAGVESTANRFLEQLKLKWRTTLTERVHKQYFNQMVCTHVFDTGMTWKHAWMLKFCSLRSWCNDLTRQACCTSHTRLCKQEQPSRLDAARILQLSFLITQSPMLCIAAH